MTTDQERFARLTEREAARLLSVVRDQAEQIAALQERIDRMDAEALRLRTQASRMRAEVYETLDSIQAQWLTADGKLVVAERQLAEQRIEAALAAGDEAPTEPATHCSSCHRPLPHNEAELRRCLGPVPQVGTTEQEQQQ